MMKNRLTAISLMFIVQFSFGQELIAYEENGKFGYQDSIGNIIITPKYDYVKDFSQGFARVNIGGSYHVTEGGYTYFKGGKWGVIDRTGKEITPIKYDKIHDFSEGCARVNIGGNFEVKKYLDGENYKNYTYFTGGKWGLIDPTGKEITPIKYDNISDFSEGRALVGISEKFGYIDTTGEEVVPVIYILEAKDVK